MNIGKLYIDRRGWAVGVRIDHHLVTVAIGPLHWVSNPHRARNLYGTIQSETLIVIRFLDSCLMLRIDPFEFRFGVYRQVRQNQIIVVCYGPIALYRLKTTVNNTLSRHIELFPLLGKWLSTAARHIIALSSRIVRIVRTR